MLLERIHSRHHQSRPFEPHTVRSGPPGPSEPSCDGHHRKLDTSSVLEGFMPCELYREMRFLYTKKLSYTAIELVNGTYEVARRSVNRSARSTNAVRLFKTP